MNIFPHRSETFKGEKVCDITIGWLHIWFKLVKRRMKFEQLFILNLNAKNKNKIFLKIFLPSLS